jgi:putative ABC transport system permease protein
MTGNYFKVAARSILKRKIYSFINAFGLSIGIAFCILIGLFILDERSFDQFHANKNLIYRLEEKMYDTWQYRDPKNPYVQSAYVMMPLMQATKDELQEVAYATRFNNWGHGIVRNDDKVFSESLTLVDADFFKMFSFKLLAGNRDKLFTNKHEVVITPPIAKKYFGDESPLGKMLQIDVEGNVEYIITGIIEAPPANSSLSFQILIPTENRPHYKEDITRWGNFNTPTFVQLHPKTDLSKFKTNIDKLTKKYILPKFEKNAKESAGVIPPGVTLFELRFTQLPDWHLKKEIGWENVSDPQYSYILGGIALLILLIACINYISLALTTSASRRTEVGIRKVVGAQKQQLIWQFSLESVVLSLISMVIGIGLVFLFLPSFNQFTEKSITISFSTIVPMILIGFCLSVFIGLLAGSYPALFLSGFRPALVLKGTFTSKIQAGFTRPLVVLQFALSAFLIMSSIVMYKQMKFVTTKDLGYDKEQIIVVPTQTGDNKEANRAVERLRARLLREPSIKSISGTGISFAGGWSMAGYKIKGEQKSAYIYGVDPYYIPTLGLKLLQGRNFDVAIPADSDAVIVNEALVRDMKWTDPTNEYLNYLEDSVGLGAKVIGVVNDHNFLSLENSIKPMFLSMKQYLHQAYIKITPGDVPQKVESIQKVWKELFPDRPFDYSFLDERVNKQYQQYHRWMSIMGFSTGFAILISCLGLFGLAGINALNRTKEMGIRKVMGAELHTIFILLNRQFIWMAVIAFVMAAPLSWCVMDKWLNAFQFKIPISWELFAGSMAAGLAVALLTASYHALKTAWLNPAETLKND